MRTAHRRAALALAAAVVAGVVTAVLATRGIQDVPFPPFLPEGQPTVITRYSGPWLTAAAGAALAAALLVLGAVTQLVGAPERPREALGPDASVAPGAPGTLAT